MARVTSLISNYSKFIRLLFKKIMIIKMNMELTLILKLQKKL